MLDAMDVNASITQPNTTNPEIDEFYAAQIDRLLGLGREDLVAELVADYERLLAERAATSNPTEADGAADTAFSLAPEREEYYTARVNELIAENRQDLVDDLVAEYEQELNFVCPRRLIWAAAAHNVRDHQAPIRLAEAKGRHGYGRGAAWRGQQSESERYRPARRSAAVISRSTSCGIVHPGRCPHAREHRDRREPRHGVHLVDQRRFPP